MGIVEPGMEAMLDVFVHETDTMLEELDEVLIDSEKAHNIDDDNINTIFRITHTTTYKNVYHRSIFIRGTKYPIFNLH